MKKVKKVSHRKVGNVASRGEAACEAVSGGATEWGPLYRQSPGFQPKDRPLPLDLIGLCEALRTQRHPGHPRFPGR